MAAATKQDIDELKEAIKAVANSKCTCPYVAELAITNERLKTLCTMVEEHDDAIKGNGKPGLKENVNILLRDLENRSKLNWLIVGGIIGNALLIVFAFIRLMPVFAAIK